MKSLTGRSFSILTPACACILRTGIATFALAAMLLGQSHYCYAQLPPAPSQAKDSKVDIAALCGGNVSVLQQRRSYPGHIKAGEVQCWGVHLRPHQFVHVKVDQQGIDLVVQLYKGQGIPVGEEIDSPNDQDGEEPVYEVSDVDTDYILAVSSGDEHPRKPDYEISIAELREAKETDRNFVMGERNFLKGQLLYAQGVNTEAKIPVSEADKEKNSKEAVADYHEALSAFDKALADLPISEDRGVQIRQQILDMSAQVLILLKDYAANLGQTEQEKVLADSLNAFDAKTRASAQDIVGDIYWHRRDFLKAEDHYAAAARMYHDMPAPDMEANVVTKIGQSYFDLGMFEQARRQYEDALKIMGVTDPVRANTKYNLGVVLDVLGETRQALQELTEAGKLFPDADVQGKVYTLHSLGRLYISLGQYPTALELIQRALRLNNDKIKDAEAYEYLYLGFINLLQGEKDPGRENTKKALQIWQELNDPRGLGNALYNLGHVAFDQGDLDTALSYLGQAAQLEENEPYGLAYSLTSMASIHAARGNVKDAETEFGKALELEGITGNRQGAVETLTLWARAEIAQGKLPEADTKLRQAIGELEWLREQVPGAALRASYFSTATQVYKLRIDLLMRLYRQEGRQTYLEDALNLSEAIHARSLLDVLATSPAGSRPELTPDLLARERELTELWNGAVVRRNLLKLSPHTPKQLEDAEQQVLSRRADWERLRDEIDNDPRYALLRPKPLTVSGIKSLLDQDTVMLEFVLGKEQSYLWMVSPNEDIQAFPLTGQRDIEDATTAFLKEVKKPAAQANVGAPRSLTPSVARDAKFIDAANTLSKMLLGQVSDRLGAKRLVIVADGILHYVPFSSLTDLANKSGEWEPLFLNHEIVVVPSASASAVLNQRARRPPAPRLLALVGDPRYDPAGSSVPASVQKSVRERAAALLKTDDIYLSFLKYEIAGIDKLQKQYAAAEGEELIHQEQVSLETATSRDLKNYRIIHYATHGVFDDKDPETSGLLLSLYDEHNQPRRDGYFLSLPDAYRMSISADMVVLSACQSALGPEVKGEGVVGLTRAFMHAGAARVVSSLWVVDDAGTSRLMTEFYTQMLKLNVAKPAAALREAQRALYLRGESPRIWASFQFQGDWKEPVRIHSSRR